MRIGTLLILGIAALGVVASIEPASARRINCGPGMNSDGYRCFPAWQRHEARGAYGYYQRGHGYRETRYYGRGYYQAPRRARGGGCYGPTGIYDPRGC
jgi:hypothetical protein